MQQDYVTKRDGSLQKIDLGKVQTRITNLHLGRINIDGNLIMLPQLQNTNPVMIAQAVIGGIKNKITTSELDQLALETAAGCIVKHNEYDTLATRLGMSDLHKSTPSTLLECAKELWNTHDSRGRHKPLISEEVWNVIQNNHIFLESLIDYSRDYNYKFFGLQTLKKIYLLKKNDVIVERPQHMIMRVSIGLYGDDFEAIKENYELMSKHYFTHATPTIFNCGTPKPTLISCFLLQIPDDSIEGIYEAVKKFAIISAGSGGIGFHQHDLRAAFSQIYGSNGKTDSIIKFLRVLNEETVHVNQGGRRPASFASYLEFWHDDIIEWIQAKRQTGDEKNRARRLFYGGWIPDLFMERVASGGKWSLMSPDDCPGLSDCYGAEFKEKYEKYESEGKFRRQVSAREIFDELITTELESGMPYICFKDHVNHKSNQKNIGVIKSSNLCVSGDTLILTNTGWIRIDTLVGKQVTVWNGCEWSEVTPFKTGTDQQLLEIKFSDGSKLKCTEYHKFYINQGEAHQVDAKDLKPGMQLIDFTFPKIECTETDYDTVPINCTEDIKLKWFETLCTTNGAIVNGEVQITSNFTDVLHETKLMLNTVGMTAHIDSNCLYLGNQEPVKVVSVQPIVDSLFDTYCFTEPKRGMGIFNGVITGQCSEVTLVSTPEETACCVLASVALPQFVSNDLKFDYPMLEKVVTRIVKGLNKVIDVNRYMTKCAEQSNMRHRPLGIGVQGLADLFYMYRTTYGEPLAKQLNKDIFEAIYYYAMKASMELAKIDGPYSTFEGSPTSRGEFQFDLWGVSPSDRYDWNQLKRDVARYGIRNSTLIALMPTASTSQLLGNSECIEPYSSNIFARSTLAGIFQVVNQYLMNDLTKLGLWNEEMCQAIIANNGSIQSVEGIPDDIKWLYRTAWELEMKDILDMSADRGAYVCQSQSLNLFKEIPKGEDSMTGMRERLRRMYFYAWKLGLKTGQYYLRTRPAKDPIKVTVQVKKMIKLANGGTVECTDEVCTMCDG